MLPVSTVSHPIIQTPYVGIQQAITVITPASHISHPLECQVHSRSSQFIVVWWNSFIYTYTYIVWNSGLTGPHSLRRSSAAARLLRWWVRISPGAWMFVCCECCVVSGSGPSNELITRPGESCRMWCVVVCDLETSIMMMSWPAQGHTAIGKEICSVEL